MKKQLVIFGVVIAVCLVLVGCGKKEDKDADQVVGGWENTFTNSQIGFDETLLELFKKANDNYKDMDLEPVAVLAKQVVAGTNYMILAKDSKEYKMVVLYKDLEGKASITNVSTFDYTKYINQNYANSAQALVGGWTVESTGRLGMLEDSNIQAAFDNATSAFAGMTYSPITVLGKQVVSGTNYAVLCFGKPSYDGMPEGVYLLTLYVKLDGTSEVTSQAYVDITKYNQ